MDMISATCVPPNLEATEDGTITTYCFTVQISRPRTPEHFGSKGFPTRALQEKVICDMLQSTLSNNLAGNVQVCPMDLDLIEI